MKSYAAVVLLALLAGASVALGALNETPAQFESRYGKEVKSTPGPKPETHFRVYEKNGINIHVEFVGERAQHVVYTRPGGFLKLQEVKLILDANKDLSGDWERLERDDKKNLPRLRGDGNHWIRRDKAEAFVDVAKAGPRGNKDWKAKSVTLATDKWLDTAGNRF